MPRDGTLLGNLIESLVTLSVRYVRVVFMFDKALVIFLSAAEDFDFFIACF